MLSAVSMQINDTGTDIERSSCRGTRRRSIHGKSVADVIDRQLPVNNGTNFMSTSQVLVYSCSSLVCKSLFNAIHLIQLLFSSPTEPHMHSTTLYPPNVLHWKSRPGHGCTSTLGISDLEST